MGEVLPGWAMAASQGMGMIYYMEGGWGGGTAERVATLGAHLYMRYSNFGWARSGFPFAGRKTGVWAMALWRDESVV